jgi:hypothetical protein
MWQQTVNIRSWLMDSGSSSSVMCHIYVPHIGSILNVYCMEIIYKVMFAALLRNTELNMSSKIADRLVCLRKNYKILYTCSLFTFTDTHSLTHSLTHSHSHSSHTLTHTPSLTHSLSHTLTLCRFYVKQLN